MTIDKAILNARIAEARKEVRLSRHELKKILKCLGSGKLKSIESGKKDIGVGLLADVADLLGLSLDYLVFGLSREIDKEDPLLKLVNQFTEEEKVVIKDFCILLMKCKGDSENIIVLRHFIAKYKNILWLKDVARK